jgi:hypothetical protein
MRYRYSGLVAAALLCSGFTGPPIINTYPRDTDAEIYFGALIANSCTPPGLKFRKAVTRYFRAEKIAGNWGSQDAQYILAVPDSCTASINLAQPTLYKITWSGSCTWTILAGLNGDGSTCVGDTGTNQSALVRWLQNSGHMETWVNSANSGNGLGLSGSSATRISTLTNKLTTLNSLTTITDTSGGTAGLHFADRTGSTAINTGLNGVLQTTAGTANSSALAANHMMLCKSIGSFCANGINELFVGFGAAMTDEAAHYRNVRTMLAGLGVGGI